MRTYEFVNDVLAYYVECMECPVTVSGSVHISFLDDFMYDEDFLHHRIFFGEVCPEHAGAIEMDCE